MTMESLVNKLIPRFSKVKSISTIITALKSKSCLNSHSKTMLLPPCKRPGNLLHLALLAAIGKVHSLPTFHTTSEHKLHQQMKAHRSCLEMIDTKTMCHASVPQLATLKEYLDTDFVQ